MGTLKWIILATFLVTEVLLAGCARRAEPGRWQNLAMERLRLAPVTLTAEAAGDDRRICELAREGLQENLVRALPRRLAPVALVAPEAAGTPTAGTGELRVAIRSCTIESHQWDVGGEEPDITFYQSLGLRVRVREPSGDLILERHLETVEQVQTDIPTPIFDFPHAIPASRIYGLFSRGRVWIRPGAGKVP
jgi:hypothetical protein